MPHSNRASTTKNRFFRFISVLFFSYTNLYRFYPVRFSKGYARDEQGIDIPYQLLNLYMHHTPCTPIGVQGVVHHHLFPTAAAHPKTSNLQQRKRSNSRRRSNLQQPQAVFYLLVTAAKMIPPTTKTSTTAKKITIPLDRLSPFTRFHISSISLVWSPQSCISAQRSIRLLSG